MSGARPVWRDNGKTRPDKTKRLCRSIPARSSTLKRWPPSPTLGARLRLDTRSPACCTRELPHPLASLTSATRLAATASSAGSRVPSDTSSLNVRQLVGEGLKIAIPGDDAILIHVR